VVLLPLLLSLDFEAPALTPPRPRLLLRVPLPPPVLLSLPAPPSCRPPAEAALASAVSVCSTAPLEPSTTRKTP
jgi:hypothetical protein